MFSKLSRIFTRRRWIGLALLIVSVTAACGPAPLGTGWPAVSLITDSCGDQSRTSVMISYTDRIVLVNPADGSAAPLLDSDCQVRPPDSDGKLKVWDFRPGGGRQFYTLPARLDENTLLAVAYDQRMFRIEIDAARPDDVQGYAIAGLTGHTVAEPLLTEDKVYLGLSAKDLIALDRRTLTPLWTATTEHGVWSKPLLADGVLYFASLDHNLYAVDAETGADIWDLDLGGALTSTPVLANGKLYLGSFARKVYEVSLDGNVLSQYDTTDWVWGSPVIIGTELYTADLGGSVYALDISNGLTETWKQKVAAGGIRAAPVVTGDVILVGARDQKLYWLNRADGTPFRDSEGNALVRELSAPILSDVLLVEPGNGVDIPEPYVIVSTMATGQILAAYTLDNGQAMWSYSFQ
ncbi:MAG: PQQ-binding-like beta-propeller repeat protein [Anaerolineae bacterium]|nr:PQQ-binding-like beta-propeller repeat protein [Anaerolineae bacterium]